MANKKIEPDATGKYKLKGKDIPGHNTEIEVDLGSNDAKKYDVVAKEIPADPTPYEGGEITWFNAYGIKLKDTDNDADITYTVTLYALPANKMLFAKLPSGIQRLEFKEAGNGKIKFTWNVGDPPLGWGP